MQSAPLVDRMGIACGFLDGTAGHLPAVRRRQLTGFDETQEGLAVLAEYLTGGLDPRRLRVLAVRWVAIGKMLDGAAFLEIFESLRAKHRIPTKTAWSIAIRVVGAVPCRTRSICRREACILRRGRRYRDRRVHDHAAGQGRGSGRA
jgi:hypothetical protein